MYDFYCESRVALLDEIAGNQQQTTALNFSCVISLLCLSFACSQKSELAGLCGSESGRDLFSEI